MSLFLHIALAVGVMLWYAITTVNPVICLAVYVFGMLAIDGPRRRV